MEIAPSSMQSDAVPGLTQRYARSEIIKERLEEMTKDLEKQEGRY